MPPDVVLIVAPSNVCHDGGFMVVENELLGRSLADYNHLKPEELIGEDGRR